MSLLYPRPVPLMESTYEAFRYHWLVWRLTGIDRPPRVPLMLYRCYAIMLNTLVTILFPLTLIAKLFYTHSLQQLCENLTITITDIISSLKFLNVFCLRRKLILIKQILDVLDARAQSRQERQMLQHGVRCAHNCFRLFWYIFSIGICLSVLNVAIAGKRTLLYPAWFFVDWQRSNIIYAIVLCYQLFGLTVQAIQDCANDSYPPAYLCVLTAHMRVLEIRVRKIGVQLVTCARNEQTLEQNYHELLACIEDHLNILKLHAIIQQLLSISCLAQFISSALVQCTVSLHFLYVVNERDFAAQMLSLIFFGAVTLEVFIICYFGHGMRHQSEAIYEAFYACEWMAQLPQFKRNLLIILIRTQRPLQILAGGYIPVDLTTFVLLMKYTYSAFTILMRFK